MRRKIGIMLIMLSVFFTVPVYSTPLEIDEVPVEEKDILTIVGSDAIKETLISHILELKSEMLSFSVSQESKMYYLSCITKMYKDLYYLTSIEQINMSDIELADIALKVRIEVDTYVKKYGISDRLLTSEIDVEQTSKIRNTLKSELKQIIESEIPSIVENELIPLLEEEGSKKESGEFNYSFVISRHQETLFWSNEILNSIIYYQKDLESIESKNEFLAPFIGQLISAVRANQVLENKQIKNLLEAAKELQPSIKKEAGSISVKQNIEYQIEALAGVKRKEGWNELDFSIEAWEPDSSKVELELAYIAMLACTSVYSPFRSHVGDEDYLEALKSLASTEEQDKIITLFNVIKDKRKPLYYSDLDSSLSSDESLWGSSYKDYKGTSYRATLNDMIRFSEEETDIMFFTVRGGFRAGDDSNSWSFYQAPFVAAGGETVKSSSEDEKGASIVADDSISTEKYTRTLFEMGSSPGTASIGLMLFKNTYNDLRNTIFLEQNKTALLYVNVFGDIVLSDNTVVIPGASNPLMYSPEGAYNPYTVSFMNSYPRVAQDADSIRVQSKNDFNKYMLFVSNSLLKQWGSLFRYVFDGSNNIIFTDEQVNSIHKFDCENLEIRKIQSDEKFSRSIGKRSISLYPFFYGGPENNYSFARFSHTDAISGYQLFDITPPFFGDCVALTFEQVLTNNKVTLFPYHKDENNKESDDSFKVPKYIAQNMYWYYTHTDSGEMGTSANSNIRSDYLYENFIIEMLQGTEFVSAYEKNVAIDSVILGGDENKQLEDVKYIAKSFLDNIGEFNGVLGIASPDSEPLFGSVLQFLRRYIGYLFCFFMVIFIFRYMKRGDLLYIVVMTLLSGIFLYTFIFIIPYYLPACYNTFGSMFTESLVSDTLLYKAEKYSAVYGKKEDLESENDYDIQTVSMTLYKMSEEQLNLFSEEYDIPYETFRYGGRVIIDPNIGLFLQGNSLKINTDMLLSSNPITGGYLEGEYGNYYHLTAEKKTSSVLDYYCPFYLLEDGFVDTLNSLLKVYNIPRTTVDYMDGLVKDSYVVFNYTNSIPFLYGDGFGEGIDTTPIEYKKLEDTFPNPNDFLNMSEWVNDPPPKVYGTLWYQTMVDNGFYDPIYGAERRQNLIHNVNNQTKKYLIENQPLIGLVSDENIIKITSLQAMFFFNAHISDIGNWVYPVAFNQEELRLNDVFVTALTANNDRFVKHNFDLVEYTTNSYGILGLVMLIVILFLSLLTVVVIKFSFPFFYLALVFLIVYRFLTDQPIGVLMKGYLKITFVVVCIYTTFIVMIAWIPKVVSGMTMLAALMLLCVILSYLLFVTILGFLKDAVNMGNTGVIEAFAQSKFTGVFVRPLLSFTEKNISRWSGIHQYDDIESSLTEDELVDVIIQEQRKMILNSLNQSENLIENFQNREPSVTYNRSASKKPPE